MTAPREFTLAEARAALATIRGHVDALRAAQAALRDRRRQLHALNRRHLNNGVAGEREGRVLRREQRRLGEQAQRLVAAIMETGVEIKGIDDGLIDFPATVHGVPAYWCWRASEAEIAWWHPRSAGFAGRRPIDARGEARS